MSKSAKQALLRQLPKVDAIAADPTLADAALRLGSAGLMRLVRAAVQEQRDHVLATGQAPEHAAVVARTLAKVERLLSTRARRVINATGVLLHTNLGRAPLSSAAVQALSDSAGGYTSIELDLDSGRRGARGAFAEQALAQLTAADAALVVNNNAAAVLLALTALARGKGVIVSRGELVEIGGGFRVPDVLARSGAEMIEVGTTNRTRLADFAEVLDQRDDVAAILRVHQGNFRQSGFVERPALADLAALARARGVLLIKDLGGGALVDLSRWGPRGEPLAIDCVSAGAHLTCFSCDKVLGGPQGGAIVGDAALVERVRRDPLARALRLGRLPLVALEATLASYLEGDLQAVPVLHALAQAPDQVKARVARWQAELAARDVDGELVELVGAVGGGTLAEEPVLSFALAIEHADVDALARRLRSGDPPVMPRIQDGRLLLDGRSVLPDEEDELLAAVVAAVGSP
jgi:L-seryl-tRNA(Ser) seleniumtransferase